MTFVHRRNFLQTSLIGFGGALWFSSPVFGQNDEATAPVEGLDSLFLTWQRDPTTTMTIQWVGPEVAAPTEIQFAKVDDGVWQRRNAAEKPYPDTNLKVHRCELTELSPGTEYQFQVGPQSKIYRFRTMPSKGTNTIQFVSGGDAGIDVHAINTNILAGKQEPSFALIGGDLAYDNGKSPETFLAFLKNYSQHVIDAKGRMVPMISCPGNHEVKGGYSLNRADAPAYLSVFDGFFTETSYGVLDFGDYLSIVMLDTNHLSPIAGAQTDWLAKTLADREDRPHVFVANHVPAYPSVRDPQGKDGGPGTGADNRKHWCPLFERYKVDVVLEHHDHAFKRTRPLTNGLYDEYGVPYLGDGSWGKIRTPKRPEERPYLATVSEAFHVSVHRLEGKDRYHVALEESGKIADVYHTSSKRPSKRG